jgi:catechol 2,3-dioxygenase-like lactoylglutathione lyase family enzyme
VTPLVKRLHHFASRCRDSEQTRRFYEDFLGLPLVCSMEISETKTGGKVQALHTFYAMGDGSMLAFFDVPGMPFEFKPQHDFDLHVALEVDERTLQSMFEKGRAWNVVTRGISDHGMIRSIYFEDPNGYVVELTAKATSHDTAMDPLQNDARGILNRWQAARRRPPA